MTTVHNKHYEEVNCVLPNSCIEMLAPNTSDIQDICIVEEIRTQTHTEGRSYEDTQRE